MSSMHLPIKSVTQLDRWSLSFIVGPPMDHLYLYSTIQTTENYSAAMYYYQFGTVLNKPSSWSIVERSNLPTLFAGTFFRSTMCDWLPRLVLVLVSSFGFAVSQNSQNELEPHNRRCHPLLDYISPAKLYVFFGNPSSYTLYPTYIRL